jgi:hypothetical protein
VLYALDAKTGKERYNSGNAITGWVHFSGLRSQTDSFSLSITTRRFTVLD